MKKLILISGYLQSGKNTFAKFLQTEFEKNNKTVTQDYFAKGVKDGCKEDFELLSNVLNNIANEIKMKIGLFADLRMEMFNNSIINDVEKSINKIIIKPENWYENKTEITRTLLQIYGTQIFRNKIDNNWWVKQLKNKIIKSKQDFFICTDCRFPNEIEEMFSNLYQTIIIRIERNINTNRQEIITVHESETALDNWENWNYEIENIGTLKDLEESAILVANDIILQC